MNGGESLVAPALPTEAQLSELQILLLTSMAEGVSLSTEDGFIVYTNPAEDRMFGYAPGELLGRHVTILNAYPPEENARIVAGVIRALQEQGHWRGEWLNRRKDGTSFYTDARITAAELEGRRYWLCVQGDITERKRTEAALAAAQAEAAEKAGLLDAILSTTPDPIFFLDQDKRYRFISAAGLAAIGMTAERTIGRTWQEIGLPSEVMAPVDAQLDQVLASGTSITSESEYPAGVFYEYHLNPMLGAAGAIEGVVASSRDITARKQTEEALRRSEEKLRIALDAARLGAWERDFRTGAMYASPVCKANLGLSPDAPFTFEMLQSMRHPDDLDWVSEAIRTAIAERADYDVEYRAVWPDGSIHWLIARGHALYDEAGRPIRMVGVTLDITERKKLEQTLRESEARFRQLADSMPQIVWTATADGWPDYYNRKWYEYTGLPDGALSRWHSVLHPEDVGPTREDWLSSVRTGEPCVLEYRLRSNAGDYRWHLGRSLPMRDASGEIVHWFCTCTDIDEIKRAEADLADHRDELVRQADVLRKALEEREILFKEVHHRVKNNLQVICSLIRMQARRIADRAGQAALDDTYNRIFSISLVHEVLYGEHEAAALDVGSYLGKLCGTLSKVYAAPERGVAVQVYAAGTLDLVRAVPLGLLANELISNALKHAFPAGRSGRVTVGFRVTSDGCELLVSDNGIGMTEPGSHDPPASLGTTIIHALVHQLGATLRSEVENGTVFRITFPA